jgi:hypothetical protein
VAFSMSPTEAGNLITHYERMGWVSCSKDYSDILIWRHTPREVLINLPKILKAAGMEITEEGFDVGNEIFRGLRDTT